MKKTATRIASDIYNDHYMVLFDSESDKGEEILVSLLAQKNALVTVGYLLKSTDNPNLYNEVKKVLTQTLD